MSQKEYYAVATFKEKNVPEIIYIERKRFNSDDFLEAYKSDNPSFYWQSFPFPLFIQLNHPEMAINDVIRILKEVKKFDEEKYNSFHKGNPYWLGTSFFLLGDFQTATFFMSAAVREDLNRGLENTPATKFIELRGEEDLQASRSLVEYAQNKLEEQINIYNEFINFNSEKATYEYMVEDIRVMFLEKSTNINSPQLQSLATAFISFILEFNSKTDLLNLVKNPTSKEPFLLHLFKGCLLLESLLKENPTKPQKEPRKTLGSIYQALHKELFIKPNLKINTTDFNDILDLLKNFDNTLNMAFQIAGMIRNTVGHSLGWEIDLNSDIYKKQFDIIMNCCLHSIFSLYK